MGNTKLGETYILKISLKKFILLMYLLVSKFRFLEFRLLLSRVAPYYSLLPQSVDFIEDGWFWDTVLLFLFKKFQDDFVIWFYVFSFKVATDLVRTKKEPCKRHPYCKILSSNFHVLYYKIHTQQKCWLQNNWFPLKQKFSFLLIWKKAWATPSVPEPLTSIKMAKLPP